MATGGPIDQQREDRWPNMTPANNVKVELKAEAEAAPEDEDGFSDIEGYAPIPGARNTVDDEFDEDDKNV